MFFIDNSEIQSAIEQAKMKLPIITRDTVKKSRFNSGIESLIPNQDSPSKLSQPLFKSDQVVIYIIIIFFI